MKIQRPQTTPSLRARPSRFAGHRRGSPAAALGPDGFGASGFRARVWHPLDEYEDRQILVELHFLTR